MRFFFFKTVQTETNTGRKFMIVVKLLCDSVHWTDVQIYYYKFI